MMTTILLFALVWVLVAVVPWSLYQNNQTLRDRINLVHAIFNPTHDWQRYQEMFHQVSYERHLLYRVLYINPMKLYDRELQQLAEKHGWTW